MEQSVSRYSENARKLLANPDSPEHLVERYVMMSASPSTRAHLAIAKRAYLEAPREYVTTFNYASALSRHGQDGLSFFRQALPLAKSPDQTAQALHHIGMAYHDRGEYAKALDYYNRAGKPADISASTAKLAMGRLSEGLRESVALTGKDSIPPWRGEDLTGKTVILAHEQGFGDTLQFIRFAPLLKNLCRKLIFSGPASLAPLIAAQFDCFDDVINDVGPFEADFVTSPQASTALMGIEYDQVSSRPYMIAEPAKLPDRGRLKVGISWKGSPTYRRDHDRSTTLEAFCHLFDLPGAAFYSLQVRPAPVEIGELGLDGFIADLGSTFKDWRDTAAAVQAMDIVVTVDSANAHVAGALGKPTFLLLGHAPCWRWMSGKTTPWYSSLKIFRDWDFAGVRREISQMVQS